MMPSKVVNELHSPEIYRSVTLPMWVLYDHPSDFPDFYVLRLWDGATNTPRSTVFLAVELKEIKNAVAFQFVELGPYEGDDPKIMAVFV